MYNNPTSPSFYRQMHSSTGPPSNGNGVHEPQYYGSPQFWPPASRRPYAGYMMPPSQQQTYHGNGNRAARDVPSLYNPYLAPLAAMSPSRSRFSQPGPYRTQHDQQSPYEAVPPQFGADYPQSYPQQFGYQSQYGGTQGDYLASGYDDRAPGHSPPAFFGGNEVAQDSANDAPAVSPILYTPTNSNVPTMSAEAQETWFCRQRHRLGYVPVPQGAPRWINSVSASQDACRNLGACHMLAVDIEGVDLSRTGEICIITIASPSTVYLFDIVSLRGAAFKEGGLEVLLSNPAVDKLFFDARTDTDALRHQYGVYVNPICDLQVMAHFALLPADADRVMGMANTFRRLGLLTPADRAVKDQGGKFFRPETGGSYENWKVRPLPPLLVDYCAVDVKYFFLAHELLREHAKEGREIGSFRAHQIWDSAAGACKGPQGALRDF